MLFVIVTIRSLFWILCSIFTFMLSIYSLGTPKWIMSPQVNTTNSFNRTVLYSNSLGLYNRCKYSRWVEIFEMKCYISALNFGRIYSVYWKVCIIAMGAASILLAIACLFAVISMCRQLCHRKSLMNLAGILQAFAGIILVVAIIFFPLGWDNPQVRKQCYEDGEKAFKFKLGACSIGIAYFCAMGATAGAFFCATFSFVADRAVFSEKVQDEILEGKQLICVF